MTTSTRPAPQILALAARDHRTSPALFARIETDVIGTPITYNLSKLTGESGWTIDATFWPNGAPIHANGFGARFCITKKVNEAITAQLDAAAEAL